MVTEERQPLKTPSCRPPWPPTISPPHHLPLSLSLFLSSSLSLSLSRLARLHLSPLRSVSGASRSNVRPSAPPSPKASPLVLAEGTGQVAALSFSSPLHSTLPFPPAVLHVIALVASLPCALAGLALSSHPFLMDALARLMSPVSLALVPVPVASPLAFSFTHPFRLPLACSSPFSLSLPIELSVPCKTAVSPC